MKTISSRTVVGLLCLFGFWMVQTASAAQEPEGRSAWGWADGWLGALQGHHGNGSRSPRAHSISAR